MTEKADDGNNIRKNIRKKSTMLFKSSLSCCGHDKNVIFLSIADIIQHLILNVFWEIYCKFYIVLFKIS